MKAVKLASTGYYDTLPTEGTSRPRVSRPGARSESHGDRAQERHRGSSVENISLSTPA